MPISFWHAAHVTFKVTLLIYKNKKAANGTQQKDVLLVVIFLSLCLQLCPSGFYLHTALPTKLD